MLVFTKYLRYIKLVTRKMNKVYIYLYSLYKTYEKEI